MSSRPTSSVTPAANPEPRRRALTLLVALAAAALVAGCGSEPTQPDLRRLYRGANLAAEQPPLIVIPGIMGSKLRDAGTGEVVWPGTLWNLVSNKFDVLAFDIDPQTLAPRPNPLEAFDITDTAAGHDFYNRLIETLENHGDFKRTTAGTPVTDPYERHFYVLPYDWRRDNVQTARQLDALIEQIRRDYGRPDLKVDIVAHSMGGLVSRYFQRFGTDDVLDRDDIQVTMKGAAKINRLILLGTPSLGSANTIRGFVEGEKIVRTVSPETLATMASAYELLPHTMRKPLIGIDGRPLRVRPEDPSSPEVDLFDPAAWRDLQWSVYDPIVAQRVVESSATPAEGEARLKTLQAFFDRSLVRAGRFQRALALPEPESSVKLVVFGADCALTPSRVLVEQEGGRRVPRFAPDDIKSPLPGKHYDLLMLEPGDGRVVKPSLLGRQSIDPTVQGNGSGSFPIAFSFFLCEDHDQLTNNINFQDNLLNALLSRSGP